MLLHLKTSQLAKHHLLGWKLCHPESSEMQRIEFLFAYLVRRLAVPAVHCSVSSYTSTDPCYQIICEYFDGWPGARIIEEIVNSSSD